MNWSKSARRSWAVPLAALMLPLASFLMLARSPELPPAASAEAIQQAVDAAERDLASARTASASVQIAAPGA